MPLFLDTEFNQGEFNQNEGGRNQGIQPILQAFEIASWTRQLRASTDQIILSHE